MKRICPSCKREHYYTTPRPERKHWGDCCSKVCFEAHTIESAKEFLDDLPPNVKLYKEGGLIVIGAKRTRQQMLKDL